MITDSQVFDKVNRTVPEDIWLTSFSILFARYKGSLARMAAGAGMLNRLEDGAKSTVPWGRFCQWGLPEPPDPGALTDPLPGVFPYSSPEEDRPAAPSAH